MLSKKSRYFAAQKTLTKHTQHNIFMKMNVRNTLRTPYYIGVLVALLCSISACRNDSNTQMGENNYFRVPNSSGVTKVFLADRGGNTATVTRNADNTWTVNGKYLARPDAAELLLETLREMRVRYSVAHAARPMVFRELASMGIKVEVYEGGSKTKTFYVGGGTADQEGTYMLREGDSIPYIMHIANWTGILTPRFLTRVDDWRDRAMIKINPDDFAEMAVEYPTQKTASFRLTKTNGNYDVKPFYVSVTPLDKPVVQATAKAYLAGLANLQAETFTNHHPKQDSIVGRVPFANITVKNTKNELHTLALYPIAPRELGNPNDGNNGNGIVERFFVFMNKTDLLLGQQSQLRNALWGYPSFFSELQKEKPKMQGNRTDEPKRYK
jgi:hypothetical protein